MRISDWSSDVCSSDLPALRLVAAGFIEFWRGLPLVAILFMSVIMLPLFLPPGVEAPRLSLALAGITFYSATYLAEVVRGGLQGIGRSEEHTSELQSLMRISYAVFCLKKKMTH